MALPHITQKEMTERGQRELKILSNRVRIVYDHILADPEANGIKEEYINKLMVEHEVEAKRIHQLKRKQVYGLGPETSFSWSVNTSARGRC